MRKDVFTKKSFGKKKSGAFLSTKEEGIEILTECNYEGLTEVATGSYRSKFISFTGIDRIDNID